MKMTTIYLGCDIEATGSDIDAGHTLIQIGVCTLQRDRVFVSDVGWAAGTYTGVSTGSRATRKSRPRYCWSIRASPSSITTRLTTLASLWPAGKCSEP